MEDNKIIAIPINEEETALSFPVKNKKLGEFISSLLGQQQSIERDIEEKFDIDHAWIMNLHEMISQRIHQQADAHLTHFSTVVYLERGLKRTFNSTEALKTYSENKKSITVGIKIIWIYLISFPSKEYPEKQQITFSAQIYSRNRNKEDSFSAAKESVIETVKSIKDTDQRSAINYQIDHTERTWGDDIESIIANQVDSALRNNRVKEALFNFFRFSLALVVFLYCLIYPFYFEIINNQIFVTKASEYYSVLREKEKDDIVGISKKMDYLSEIVINTIGSKKMKDLRQLIWIFAGPIIPACILALTRRNIYSFLTFSKEDEKYRNKKLQREKRSVLILIVSFLLSVFSGIIGNYGYAWLTR